VWTNLRRLGRCMYSSNLPSGLICGAHFSSYGSDRFGAALIPTLPMSCGLRALDDLRPAQVCLVAVNPRQTRDRSYTLRLTSERSHSWQSKIVLRAHVSRWRPRFLHLGALTASLVDLCQDRFLVSWNSYCTRRVRQRHGFSASNRLSSSCCSTPGLCMRRHALRAMRVCHREGSTSAA
jgi:hypothetical protein